MSTTVVELREHIEPPWYFRLLGGGKDGLMRRRADSLQRWMRIDGEGVLMAAVHDPRHNRVVVGARAATEGAAQEGIRRMRFAIGVDEDLRPFHDRFKDDPYIGAAVRRHPHLRVRRRPRAFEALAWAITEQLIEFDRAVEIQKRLVWRLGARCPQTRMWDAPSAAELAAASPAQLCSFDLAPKRAIAMRRVAEEVARGRIDLEAGQHDAHRRLLAIPEIGPWTIEMTALYGQGRYDMLPAGDLGYLKLVGRIRTGSPHARAEEADVREFFEPYGEWKGLAGEYLRLAASLGLTPVRPSPRPAPRPAGTRWSSPARAAA